MKKVVIVGGGIIGQFSAYYLSKNGYEVTLVNDASGMEPASMGNCGLITPSHIVPLNSLSMIVEGLKSMGKKDAPFFIQPKWDPALLKWLLSFLWHVRSSSYKRAISVRNQLLQESWKLYAAFFEDERTTEKMHTDGILHVCKDVKQLKKLSSEVDLLNKYGLAAEMLSPEELFTLEPSIRKDIVGGAIFNVDGWLNPMKLYADIKKINQSQGVQFVSGTVLSFSNNADCIEEVKMESQGIGGDLFVLCSGARSVILAQKLGINLPMVPGKGYNLTTSKKIENQPKRPIYMCERKVVATPWSSGFRLGSTMEFAGFDLSLNEVRINALLSASREYLDVDLNREDFKPWAGWRPMSSSEVPIIEASGKFSNLIIATGHGMLGLSMAPATGMAVKMLIENA